MVAVVLEFSFFEWFCLVLQVEMYVFISEGE